MTRCPHHLGELQCERFKDHLGPTHSTWDDELGVEISWLGEESCESCLNDPLYDDYEADELKGILERQPFASAVGKA